MASVMYMRESRVVKAFVDYLSAGNAQDRQAKRLNVFKKVEIEQTHSKQCAYELSASGTQVAQPENN
jgi:hypothetical protein